jgi:hypothetical protein
VTLALPARLLVRSPPVLAPRPLPLLLWVLPLPLLEVRELLPDQVALEV